VTCAQELRKAHSPYTNTVIIKLFVSTPPLVTNKQKNEVLASVVNTKYAMDMLPCLLRDSYNDEQKRA